MYCSTVTGAKPLFHLFQHKNATAPLILLGAVDFRGSKTGDNPALRNPHSALFTPKVLTTLTQRANHLAPKTLCFHTKGPMSLLQRPYLFKQDRRASVETRQRILLFFVEVRKVRGCCGGPHTAERFYGGTVVCVLLGYKRG